MRIIAFFLLGATLAFFLGAAFARLQTWLSVPQIKRLHHSAFGLILLLMGLLTLFFGQSLWDTSTKVLLGTFFLGGGFGFIFHHLLSESFVFSEEMEKKFINKHDNFIERFLEILPGALTWLALTSPLWLSFTLPFAVAYLILIADVYWLINAIRISICILVGYRKMQFAKKQDWLQKIKEDFPQEWEHFYHFVEIHTYKEPMEVLVPAFEAILDSNYPAKKIFFGIGLEERDSPEKNAQVVDYVKKNQHRIGGIFVTVHPHGLPGEIAGPATNRNWIIRNAVKEFVKKGIKPEQVLVTTLDADFVLHRQFLAGALYKYLSLPKNIRNKRSFTGTFFYINNYWQAPTPMRVIASGTAFWQLAEMTGSDKYMNFSSLSMNMQSLLDIGLWIPDKVNDDSGFYWKAYYHFKGDYKVIPHFLPITGDAVLDVSLIKTFKSQYAQLKRWAYGVEHTPFIIRQYLARKDVDFWDKTDKLFFIIWSNLKWGTLALFITFAGLLVPVINPNYGQSAVAYNLPVISSWILTAAFLGLFVTIYIHEKVVPPRPASWSFLRKMWSYLQWALLPLAIITISSIPAIDAQTRLMLGKYMEYKVTTKARLVQK